MEAAVFTPQTLAKVEEKVFREAQLTGTATIAATVAKAWPLPVPAEPEAAEAGVRLFCREIGAVFVRPREIVRRPVGLVR